MKQITLLFISILLPLFAAAQTADEYYKKAKSYYDRNDYANAMVWFEKSANLGDADAQNYLGLFYEEGLGTGINYIKAAEWYQKAADQGNAEGQNNLAYLYRKGLGVDQNYSKALELYQKAADQGNAAAVFGMGFMHEFGLGVKKDHSKALELYKKSANMGYASAQCNIGYMYQEGEGVPKDDVVAVQWYKKAANQGHKVAQCNLGVCYEDGIGVPKDYSKALSLYQKSADQGYEYAIEYLGKLRKKMDDLSGTELKSSLDKVDTEIPSVDQKNNNTFAVIIANEDYSRETKVEYAKNDGEIFRQYCIKTLGIPEKRVHYVPDATLNDIIAELDWLQQVCKAFSEVNVIFYYAGHGVPDEASGSSYLLPTDGNSRILRTCFSINELYDLLGKLPTKKVTVLMDACFSGAKRNGGMMVAARGVAIKAKPCAPKGRMIVLSAAQGDETAYKYDDVKHGLFTYFLLKKLQESKGNVTMGELSRYIKDEVTRYSIVENGKSQTPTVQISDGLRTSWESLKFE